MSVAIVAADTVSPQIEENPLEPEVWEQLAESLPFDDRESAQSLGVIRDGLLELQRVSRHERPPPESPLAGRLFRRLAENCNDPRLLKEAGMIYLSTWRLPAVAQRHFERCLGLGEPARDLRPLIEAAALASQRLAVARAGQKPAAPVPRQPQRPAPGLADVMRQAGLQTPARLQGSLAAPITARPLEGIDSPLPKNELECLREAPRTIAEGRLERARDLLLRAGDNPRQGRETAQAWAALGKAHYETGDFRNMEMAYQEASKSEPETMVAHFNLALAKQLNRKFEQAEALYLTADRIQPNHPKVLCNLGSLYLQQNRNAEAEKVLRRALRADPEYARAWDNLAAALEAQDQLDPALDACRHAIERRPGYPDAYFRMGVIYFTRNRPAEAAEALRHAIHSAVFAPAAHAYLGALHARLGQLEPAATALVRAGELQAEATLIWTGWNELGKAHYARGAYAAATEAFAKATTIRRGEPEGWFNLGLAYHMAGAPDPARESYRRTVDLDSARPLAWHNLGLICAASKRHAEAVEAFQAELKLQPGNALSWYDLGLSLEAEGRQVEARNAFSRAEELENRPAAHAA